MAVSSYLIVREVCNQVAHRCILTATAMLHKFGEHVFSVFTTYFQAMEESVTVTAMWPDGLCRVVVQVLIVDV